MAKAGDQQEDWKAAKSKGGFRDVMSLFGGVLRPCAGSVSEVGGLTREVERPLLFDGSWGGLRVQHWRGERIS